MEKLCKSCKSILSIDNFPRSKRSKDGYDSLCKSCRNQINCNYRHQNIDKVKEARKKYYLSNIDKMRIEKKEYYAKNKEKKSLYDKVYRLENKEKIADYKRIWDSNDRFKIESRIKRNLRRRLIHAIKKENKSISTIKLLGCDILFFIEYIESLFQVGMNWDNYGQFGWHIDHILPCSSFDLTLIEEQQKCFHYSNLQPLWWHENLSKAKKIL